MNNSSPQVAIQEPNKQLNGSTALWEQSLETKKQDLSNLLALLERRRKRKKVSMTPVIGIDEAVKLKDIESFQNAVQQCATQFKSRQLPRFMNEYLYPKLDRLRQFSQGLASAVQADPTRTGSLVFGLLFIVVQCGCMFAESFEGIFKRLQTLESQLPSLQIDQSMYPSNQRMKSILQNVLCYYVDYCIEIVRHMTRKSIWVLVRSVFSLSLDRDLSKISHLITHYVADFDREVQQAERKRSSKADEATHVMLKSINPAKAEPKFPVRSVNIEENKSFTGREADLAKMHKYLIQDHVESRPVSCGLHGIGGVGKTQTALKFLYKYGDDFDAIFWVSADPEKGTEIQRTFGGIGVSLKLFDEDIEIGDQQINQVTQWLITAEVKWLLVFDNVVNRRDLAPYWPTHSRKPCVILLTSQIQIGGVDHKIPIQPLNQQQGVQFLLDQLGLDDDKLESRQRDTAAEISHVLGGSPLWLKSAQGIIEFGCTFQECLEQLRADVDFPEGNSATEAGWEKDSNSQYERAAVAAHDYLLKQLPASSLELLFMTILMNPDDISEAILLRPHDEKEDNLDFLHNKSVYLNNVAELTHANLIQRDTANKDRPYLRMHRALQRIMLRKLSKEEYGVERTTAFKRVVRILRENFPPPSKVQIAESSVWPNLQKVLPHLLTLLQAFEAFSSTMKGDIEFAELLCDVGGMDLWDRGKIAESYWINMNAEKILDSIEDTGRDLTAIHQPDQPLLTGKALKAASLKSDALTISGLSTDFMALSKRQEGFEMRQRCKKIRQLCFQSIPEQEVSLDDKIRLYNSYGDLATSLQQLNDFEGVRENMEECLKNYKLWGDEDAIPYEYAKYYSMTSFALIYERDYGTAVDYAEKAYKLIEERYPGTSSAILHKSDYALVLFQTGKDGREEAEKILKDLLTDSERDCGEANTRTLELRMIYGIMLYFLDRLDEARTQIELALATGENKIQQWPVENGVRGRYYLSQILKRTDAPPDEARKMEREAIDSLNELLKLDVSGKSREYEGDYPMLFDYLVNWECRLVTPRQATDSKPVLRP